MDYNELPCGKCGKSNEACRCPDMNVIDKDRTMNGQCVHCTLVGDIKRCAETECSLHDSWYATQLKADLKAAQEERDTLTNYLNCDVCGGHNSPHDCMCGGTGRMDEAARYLREQLVNSERDLASAQADKLELVEALDRLYSHPSADGAQKHAFNLIAKHKEKK